MYEMGEILRRIASCSPFFNRMCCGGAAVEKPSFSAIFARFSTATQPNHVESKNGEHGEILRRILHILYIQSVKMRQMAADLISVEVERNFLGGYIRGCVVGN